MGHGRRRALYDQICIYLFSHPHVSERTPAWSSGCLGRIMVIISHFQCYRPHVSCMWGPSM